MGRILSGTQTFFVNDSRGRVARKTGDLGEDPADRQSVAQNRLERNRLGEVVAKKLFFKKYTPLARKQIA